MNTVTKLTQIFTVTLILGSTLNSCTSGETRQEKVLMRERPDCTQANVNYAGNRSPLRPMNFIKLPVGAIQPEGWLKKYLNLQKEGLTQVIRTSAVVPVLPAEIACVKEGNINEGINADHCRFCPCK